MDHDYAIETREGEPVKYREACSCGDKSAWTKDYARAVARVEQHRSYVAYYAAK